MQESSFYFFAARQSPVATWFSGGGDDIFRKRLEEVHEDAGVVCKKPSPLGVEGGLSPVQSASGCRLLEYKNAGFAIKGSAGGTSKRKPHARPPLVSSTSTAAFVLNGYSLNFDDLVEECKAYDGPHLGQTETEGAAGAVLQRFLRTPLSEAVVLLSELQGHFAFVAYDETRKAVLAARDPSGEEPLYYSITSEGVALTDNPANFPRSHAWKELPPGHYLAGRNPKAVQQFALTIEQVSLREHAMREDEMSLSPHNQLYEVMVDVSSSGKGSVAAASSRSSCSSQRSSAEETCHPSLLAPIA